MSGSGMPGHVAHDTVREGRTGVAPRPGRDGPMEPAGAPGGDPGHPCRDGHAGRVHDTAGEDGAGRSHDEIHDGVQEVRPLVVPALAAALAHELVRRADEDQRVTRAAHRSPTLVARRRITECRRGNAEALKTIVKRHAWPTADLVGAPASTAALMILLHAPDLDFQLACRDLIAQATADGRCPAPHHAYIADHCAVELGQPQFYGTRVDPATFRPYPVRQPRTLDERREDVGLCPLDEQMRALRLGV
ncbi:DUF6624 domain-containing protein [Streptomyces phaeochromogenes]|uniref:DUF6624 domain-containing protein n=1 Tax=Streptomyces phaeochromogenes TaxID=1923 RepID=UPI002B1D8F99|nr:DUF6624 domain-containing protein [Streptomyces phaeochromogenes]